jgi:hypothetical protein
MKRFQECNRLEKAWRCRWYFAAPFIFYFSYLKEMNSSLRFHPYRNGLNSKILWKLIIGEIQFKMKWYYTSEEVRVNIKERINKKIQNLSN